jgi:HEAT repeat protein
MKKIACIATVYLVLALVTPPLMAEQKTSSPGAAKSAKSYAKILVCTMIFDALGKIGDPGAAPLLTKGLKSNEFFMRAYAAQALGRLGDKNAASLLLGLIDDKNYLVRVTAVESLIKLGNPGMKQRLLEFLKADDVAVRTAAVSHLTELGDTFIPAIQQVIMTEKDPVVRAKALEQLDKTEPVEPEGKWPEGIDPLFEMARRSLEDPAWQVRQAGCVALARLEDRKSIPLLIEHLGDESPFVRAAAKEALAKLGETSLIKFFWQDINETDSVLKASSFIALAYLNDINVIPVLLKEIVAAGTPPLVRKEAARALVLLKPYLSKLLDDSLMISHLNDIISSDNLGITFRINGKSLAEIFIRALKDPGDPLHNDAPLVLRELNDPAALPALREALSTDDPDIVAACAFALGELHDTQATDVLIKTCNNYPF